MTNSHFIGVLIYIISEAMLAVGWSLIYSPSSTWDAGCLYQLILLVWPYCRLIRWMSGGATLTVNHLFPDECHIVT